MAKTKEDLAIDKIKYEEIKSKEIQFTAERVEVKVGLEDSSYYEILDGIDEHVLVITLGQMNLKPGSVIEITSLENILNPSSNISKYINTILKY